MSDVVAIVREEFAADELQHVQLWARQHQMTVVRVISPEMADLGRVIDDAQRDDTDTIGAVVASLSVLGDVVHQEAFRTVLERAGGMLHVVDQDDAAELVAPGPERALLQRATGTVHALLNMVNGARLSRGSERRRERLGRSGGRAPFGMKFVAGELVADTREEAVKRRMKELRAQGMGYSAIARRVEAEGYLKRDGSAEWHPDMVRRILLREAS
jgi:hypothetical protein